MVLQACFSEVCEGGMDPNFISYQTLIAGLKDIEIMWLNRGVERVGDLFYLNVAYRTIINRCSEGSHVGCTIIEEEKVFF